MFGERVSPGPTNQRSFLCLPCCWGQMLVKQQPLIHLDCLCSVSLPISVFFTHSLLVVLREGQTTISKRRGLIACVPNNDTNGKLLSPNHLWSLPAALTLTFLLVSTRGLFQDMMFDRLHYSTLSEDASEVCVQPFPYGTEKANSVARVVVKPTPRLCGRCASYT